MASPEALSFAYLEAHPADAARVLERLAPQDAAALLLAAPARLTAPVLRQMLPLHAARCLERLDDATASGLLLSMGPQAGVALLRYLPEARRAQLVAQLPTPMAVAFRLLLGYTPDTVGAWMDPRALALPADLAAGDALERVRQSEPGSIDDLYVLDHEQRLRGAVALAALVRAEPQVSLSRLMQPAADALPARSQLASVREHPGWSEHRILPVVERGERFVGALRHAVLLRALVRSQRIRGPRTEDALTGLADAYWAGVSGLIGAVVGMLPADAGKQPNGSEHDN